MPESSKRAVEALVEGWKIIGTPVGQAGLGIRPDALVRVQLWRVRGEVVDVEPGVATLDLRDRGPLVNGEVVPEDRHRSAQVPQEVLQEAADLRVTEVATVAAKVESDMLANRTDRDAGDHRVPVMPVAMVDPRCLAAARPGPPQRGDQEEARFVDEDEVRLPACGVFFTLGHVSRFHRSMRPSSRSKARRCGFWELKPSRWRSRPTWSR